MIVGLFGKSFKNSVLSESCGGGRSSEALKLKGDRSPSSCPSGVVDVEEMSMQPSLLWTPLGIRGLRGEAIVLGSIQAPFRISIAYCY